MIDYELKKYLLFDIDNTKKFIKERRKTMRKKDIKKEFERLNDEIGRLETLVKAATDKAEKAQKKIDILEFAGTFDMNKVEIKVDYELKPSFVGFIAQNPVIKVKYIKNNRVEVSKLLIDDETLCKLTSRTPKIIKNNDKHVLFSIGDHNFVLSRETGFMMEYPAKEKKS